MAAVPSLVIDLNLPFGLLVLGFSIGQAFWGIHCFQTVYYFINYPKDRPILKVIVVLLWVLDTAHQFLVLKGLWKPLLSEYGDYGNLLAVSPELIVSITCFCIRAIYSDCFHVHRFKHYSLLSLHS